jgi:methionyl-tRNA formyltransferase/RimJ/RimL family protein N-acetyltransferase
MIEKVLIFGDDLGLPQLLRHLPSDIVCGMIIAEIRPHQYEIVSPLAERYCVPLRIQPRRDNPEYPDFVNWVQKMSPDLIFVNSYSMLLHPEILSIPANNAINVHGALLPEYRGANPTQWAIINNEPYAGVTLHYMTDLVDQGDIISQKKVPLNFEDTWLEIQARVADATEKMLADEIPKILAGTNVRVQQDERVAKHWPRRKPEDGLINWDMNVLSIYNLIRALVNPHPGAFYLGNTGQKIILDAYLSIPRVIMLKYSRTGGRKDLKSEHIEMVPFNENDVFGTSKGIDKHPVFAEKSFKQEMVQMSVDSVFKCNNKLSFSIRILENNIFIGVGHLHNIDYRNRSSDVEIIYNNKICRDVLYASEIIHLTLNIAFNELDLHRVSIMVPDYDDRILELYTHIGFREKKFSQNHQKTNNPHEGWRIMEIQRNNYER